jgi:hypothetical protein
MSLVIRPQWSDNIVMLAKLRQRKLDAARRLFRFEENELVRVSDDYLHTSKIMPRSHH